MCTCASQAYLKRRMQGEADATMDNYKTSFLDEFDAGDSQGTLWQVLGLVDRLQEIETLNEHDRKHFVRCLFKEAVQKQVAKLAHSSNWEDR